MMFVPVNTSLLDVRRTMEHTKESNSYFEVPSLINV